MKTKWLQPLRGDWEIRRPKSLFKERREPSRTDDVHLTPSQTYGVLPQQEYMDITGSKVVLNLTGADNMKHVEPNDFVIHLRSFQGGIELSSHRGKVSNAYTVFAPSAEVEPPYYRWVLKSQGFIQELRTTTEQLRDGQSIRFEQFADIGIPWPPLEEQRRIADFLDDQVTRIDNIIAARQQQAALAGEAMQAGIDHVSDSGGVRRLRSLLLLLRDGTHTPPERRGEGVPLLTAKNVRTQRLELTDNDTYISDADADELDRSFTPTPEDVLFSVKGSVGNVATVPVGFPRFQVERNLALLRPNTRFLTKEWLYWVLRTRAVQDQVTLAMGFSAQPGVYLGSLASLTVPVPSLSDQATWVENLQDRAKWTARVHRDLAGSISRLAELKRSLISAAVSGEFDVSSASGRGVSV